MNNDKIKKAIDKIISGSNELMEYWSKDIENLGDYPFSKSFDEVILDIEDWLEGYSKPVDEGLKIAELTVLADTYNAITRKIEQYVGHDENLLLELEQLESIFQSNIDKLAYTKHKVTEGSNEESELYRASHCKDSMNVIIVDGVKISFYDFFNNYIPFSVDL